MPEATIRPLVVSALAALLGLGLGLGISACGGSGGGMASEDHISVAARDGATTAVSKSLNHNNDRDNDGDHNNDDASVLDYGHPADAADQRASVALVMGYFAAAAAGDGARACSLLIPFIAESVPENAGHTPSLRGKTCATVMSKLFGQRHAMFAEKNASLKVLDVRIEGDKALAVLNFTAIPEVRQMIERRIGGTWKILDLVDDNLE